MTPNDEQGRVAPLLAGFTILLVALFAVAFGVGRLAGPVAPGMHRVVPGANPAPTAPAAHGTRDMPGMPGMEMSGGRPGRPPALPRPAWPSRG